MTDEELQHHAQMCRRLAIDMACNCGTSAHLGGGLSLIEILSVLYGSVMGPEDKFILSKGHGVLGLYAVLAEFGRIPKEKLNTFLQDGSPLMAHPVMNDEYGIEASSGSLGQGISMAVGLAMGAKLKKVQYETYVLCGNGEANEGSVWEAAMSAVHFKLDNFTLIIDNNNMQSDGNSNEVMNISGKYSAMFEALGFETFVVDGHDIKLMREIFTKKHEKGIPRAIVASTVKGKGVSFMEGNNEWHHNRLTEKQYEEVLKELKVE